MTSILIPWIWWRARRAVSQTTVIGITGTAGTLFVATCLTHLLGKQKNVQHFSAEKPAQLARLIAARAAADVTIAEYPLTAPGDIDVLARQLPPHIAVITALHSRHLDLFQNRSLIAHEAASLLAAMPKGTGKVILSADDSVIGDLARHAKGPITWYGAAPTANVRLQRLSRRPQGGLAAEIAMNGAPFELHLPNLIARHHVQYLLAALAAARAAGADMKKAVLDSQSYQPPAHTMQRLPGNQGAVIVDDTAEQTPESTMQALEIVADVPTRRRIAILGSIPRLGSAVAQLHQDIGIAAAGAVDILITIGDEARLAHDAAARTHQQCDLHHLSSGAEAARWLAPHLKTGDLVLVKMQERQGREVITRLSAAEKVDSHRKTR